MMATTNDEVNPYEQLARERKVHAMLAVLRQAAQGGTIDEHTLEQLDDEDYQRMAKIAGVNPPGPETVKLFKELALKEQI